MTDDTAWPGMYVSKGFVWPTRTCQISPPTDVATATYNIDSYNRTLTVISEHGPAFPAVGIHTNYCWYSEVPCSVDPWVRDGGTNFICTGYTAGGNLVPNNYVTLTLHGSASITWHWEASEYRVDAFVEGEGSVNLAPGWYSAGTTLALLAVPEEGWLFTGWSGDFAGGHTASNTMLTVDGYKNITAHFSDDADGDGLLNSKEWEIGTNPYLADSDGDGMADPDELIAGTQPTNKASCLSLSLDSLSTDASIINWTSVSGRVYNIYWSTNLAKGFQPLEIGMQYPGNAYTDSVHSAEDQCFYRIVVMKADYDEDGDGLPNDWEQQYAVRDADLDSDGDGFNNISEFIAGTDPTNGMSRFNVTSASPDATGFVIEWNPSISNRLYTVSWSTNLISGFQPLETGIEYQQNSCTDTVHNAEDQCFYKVEVGLK
jgi:hypothetical protein